MAYRSLRHFIDTLAKAGELVRIHEFVSPVLEITEVADRMVKNGGKALLFENTGTPFPLLINLFASDRRICLALGVDDLSEIEQRLAVLMKEFLGPKDGIIDKLKMLPSLNEVASWMPRSVKGRGSCQEVVMDTPDLSKLPVLTCWPADGGPFITLPGVHTKDPETGLRNLGMYRMQVFSPGMTGMHWHLHKGSASHFNRYRDLGRRMPVSVTLGGDPAYTYAATAPLPENLDEYLLAGFLRKKRVDLVRCLTNDLEVPADADFVIEGYVDPAEEPILEGPFGDHTGFYSLADYFPRFHVTCITHRRDAVYPATIVGIPPMEDGWIGKATERIFLMPIRTTVAPEVTDLHMPVEGVFHNITLTSIRKHYPGQAGKVMNALWGAGQMMFNKIMVVTDHDTRVTDYRGLARAVSERTDPARDLLFFRGPVDILDHASEQYAYGSKMGIDATRKLPQEMGAGPSRVSFTVDQDEIARAFPEITGINPALPAEGISLVILGIRKYGKGQVRETARALLEKGLIRGVRFLLFTDPALTLTDLAMVTWITANNLDPLRDCFLAGPDQEAATLCLDATSKSAEEDGFKRDWPNVITMDRATIGAVDKKWKNLNLGPFVESPSQRCAGLVTGPGAVANSG